MTTLAQIAAGFSLYQVADIPSRYINDNYDHRINCGNLKVPEFMTSLKGYEVGVFYECKQDTDYKGVITYYIEHSYLLVKRNDNDTVLMLKADRHNKYYFYPYYSLMHKYNGISYDIKKTALKGLKEPNYIGVFTEKKVNDWFNYCIEYLAILDNTLNDVADKNNEIQNKIDAFIQSVPGCHVSKYQNTTDIETPLFRVRFDHFKDQRYLSTKIDFKGNLSDITRLESKVPELA